ncbi:MAG: amidohydrolase [Chloroflexi bacterium]|nr:amidohydrolase [Chloroflexota bacterium]
MTASARQYRLISADGHFNEPGDLWTSRVSAKFRDRVPHIERFEMGDAWVFPGVEAPVPFSWSATAGRPPEELNVWCFMEDILPGSYDPKARVKEMTEDGVDAEVLFGSNFASAFIATNEDDELHYEMVRAFNDWESEFCGYAPDRLGGTALLPNRGAKGVLAEIERVSHMPGFVGFLLKRYPNGGLTITPEDDAVWEAIEASGKPLTIHVGLITGMPGRGTAQQLPVTGHFHDAPVRMLQFIFGGVLDRFPKLRIPLIEVDCGWIPYFEDQADDNYQRHRKASLKDVKLSRLPSEYMHEYFPAAFITDPFAVANRQRIGVERMLWSSDYPHITTDWPYSWKTIAATFHDVPADEKHAILAGNAQKLFKFGER